MTWEKKVNSEAVEIMSNEEIVRQIQEGKNRRENLSLLWERNQVLIDSIVRRLTGLQAYEEGFENTR